MMQFQHHSVGAQASAFVKGVRVKTTHLGYKKTVKRLHRLNARQHKFDSGDFGTVTVEQYFKKSKSVLGTLLRVTDGEPQSTTLPFLIRICHSSM